MSHRSPWSRLGLVLAVAAAATVVPPAAATVAYDAVLDLTFPVHDPHGRTTFRDDYHDARSGGRVHRATDIGGPRAYGLPVHAAVGGTVTFATGIGGRPVHATAGWMLSIRGDDGRTHSYLHLGRQDGPASEAYARGIREGVRVVRGQHLGYVGYSGNASPSWPHLHYEIADPRVVDPYGSNRMNPHPSLVDAVRRGDRPPSPWVAGFHDVTQDHPHAAGIAAIAGRGVTGGCAANRFCPERAVTRGQVATFLRNARDLPDGGTPPFDDVPADHSHARGIAAVAAAGIASGKQPGRFAPGLPVTRAQMASFLANAYGLEGDAAGGRFGDVDPAGVHAAAIDAVATAGIALGRSDGSFGPTEPVTRGQLASFLARAMGLL